ncbi:hypothetical protein JW710_03005 [Candidatus Dojkabacteria bacterium]|nr:hypothetical protein [Candidatus Dojkabacteria bacterium]
MGIISKLTSIPLTLLFVIIFVISLPLTLVFFPLGRFITNPDNINKTIDNTNLETYFLEETGNLILADKIEINFPLLDSDTDKYLATEDLTNWAKQERRNIVNSFYEAVEENKEFNYELKYKGKPNVFIKMLNSVIDKAYTTLPFCDESMEVPIDEFEPLSYGCKLNTFFIPDSLFEEKFTTNTVDLPDLKIEKDKMQTLHNYYVILKNAPTILAIVTIVSFFLILLLSPVKSITSNLTGIYCLIMGLSSITFWLFFASQIDKYLPLDFSASEDFKSIEEPLKEIIGRFAVELLNQMKADALILAITTAAIGLITIIATKLMTKPAEYSDIEV